MDKPTKDDILEYLGLQTRKSAMEYALPALGIFAGGVVLGAAVALLVAPKPGQELREDIARRIPFGSNGDPTTKSVTSGSSTSGATTTSGSRSSA